VDAPGEGTEVLLRRLELVVSRRLDGLLQGDHLGLLPGPGSEAGDARMYEPGDDVRRMDWNVTARTGSPHVRPTIADRELEVWVVADQTASLDFGTATCEKRELVLAAAAAVGFLTARVGNRLGAVLLGADGSRAVPPRPGRDHLRGLLHRVATAPRAEGGGATDLAAALDHAARLARRRGLLVVISDFLGQPGWERPLRTLAARHDVLAVEVVDPRELELPDVGLLTLVDPETGQSVEVQTSSRRLRRRYADAAAEQRRGVATALRATGVEHLVLRTDRDWLSDVVRYVELRRRRRTLAPAVRAGGAVART
jgi:uncharacterized protein (DUF58 family)